MEPATTSVYDTYWRFAAARQEVFFARMESDAGPWTSDPILASHKFTNAYRAADRVSQYLIRNVIYEGDQGPEEAFFRTVVFKVFNKIETWELLTRELGEVSWRGYDRGRYEKVLSEAMGRKERIFSAAYIMPSGSSAFGHAKKHSNFLSLIERMMEERVPLRIQQAPTMDAVYETLLSYPLIGKFLAFQYAIDLNYGTLTDFDEGSFVVAGPGAVSGVSKCFSHTAGMTPEEIIHWVTDRQEYEFDRLGIEFKSLWGRRLQPIDCQNLFCETNKYARVAHPDIEGADGRSQIKQAFRPTSNPIEYWFPPKWGINDRILLK